MLHIRKVDVTLSASLEVIQIQMQLSLQFYHSLLWKGLTTWQDHGLHPYLLGLMEVLGFWVVIAVNCCYFKVKT